MRKIKFRAWDGKRMTTSGIMFNTSTGTLDVPKSLSLSDGVLPPEMEYKLMQFTGLLSKSGKEIYEGDIINSRPKDSNWDVLICKIVFNEITARFEAQQFWENKNKFLSLSREHQYYEYEIIGNIYENPELLEQMNF